MSHWLGPRDWLRQGKRRPVRGLTILRRHNWSIMERTDDGKVCVSYDVSHADFDFRSVA